MRDNVKLMLFDTETTDLIKNSLRPLESQPRIIEFYGCLIDVKGNVLDEIDFLCNPGKSISEEVTRITRIDNSMVKDALPFINYLPQIRRILKRADGVVGHNLYFDWSIVDWEAQRAGFTIDWPILRICTVENTECLKGHRLKLADLYEFLFGERFEEAHRAKNDVMAMKRCVVELIQRGLL